MKTANTRASFESEEQALDARDQIARSRPDLAEVTAIVAFDEEGLALDPGTFQGKARDIRIRAGDIARTLPHELHAADDLTGYSVEAIDGSIGKIDEATNLVDEGYIVIDTGPFIFGRQVVVPLSVVDRIDTESETVSLSTTKDEVRDAPEFDEARLQDEKYLRHIDRAFRR